MNVTEYNGWTNYETWVVNLWLDNDVDGAGELESHIAECIKAAPTMSQVKASVWTSAQAAQFSLADRLKAWHEANAPEIEGAFADLLNSALQSVNWDEIAKNLLESATV